MLSYLIGIIRPKKFENRLYSEKKMSDMKTQRWTQKQRKNLKKPTLSTLTVPQVDYLYYSLNVEGVTQKGSLLPAHIR